MCEKTNVDIVDKQQMQTLQTCHFTKLKLQLNVCQNRCRQCRHTTSPNFNFDCMCVKTNINIVDKSSTKTSQDGEPLDFNVDIVDSTISPKFKVNQASATSISTICVRKRTQTLQTSNFTKLQFRLYVCQNQRRHCRQILHQNISKW